MNEKILKTKKEKLHFVITELHIPNINIIQKTQLQSNVVSEIINPENLSRNLKNYHLFAIALAYNIPIEIFDDDITTSSEIRELLRRTKNLNRVENKREFNLQLQHLVGEWFAYFYCDNVKARSKIFNEMMSDKEVSFIKKEKISINSSLQVKSDEKKQGSIKIGTNQSIIILEDKNSNDMMLYSFDNDRVCYNRFFVSKISKTKHSKNEILNFGFFSKKELHEKEIQSILGNFEEIQLRVQCTLLDRIGSYNDMENY
jgi:hypothetical protein